MARRAVSQPNLQRKGRAGARLPFPRLQRAYATAWQQRNGRPHLSLRLPSLASVTQFYTHESTVVS